MPSEMEKLLRAVADYLKERCVEAEGVSEYQYSPEGSEGVIREGGIPYAELEHFLGKLEDTFSEKLFQWIVKKDLKEPEVYKRAHMDRKLFSKIRNNADYRPSKGSAIALAIGLGLNLEETKDLIGRAGYALSRSSKFDMIIEYFIDQKNYDITEINEVLFAFEQPLICAKA